MASPGLEFGASTGPHPVTVASRCQGSFSNGPQELQMSCLLLKGEEMPNLGIIPAKLGSANCCLRNSTDFCLMVCFMPEMAGQVRTGGRDPQM